MIPLNQIKIDLSTSTSLFPHPTGERVRVRGVLRGVMARSPVE